ncbi:type I DNA topoisomerase [Candidatus Parcubacteria bacterium]|nr:type I DNA topoisomerase [Candidatus Parcubacteria bacterium]
MRLVIVESPSKAKTIEKYLGKDFKVVASVGHVRDLPKSQKAAIDVPGGFIPHYEVVKGKEHIISEIKTLAKKASEVLLATDPDREGEAIAWHIKEAVGLKHPKRIVFHEITKEAVEEAIEHPRDIDNDLKEAQEARRVLDRLVGYDLSGLIWKKVRYGLSAGRVQSPALRIIMEREREIRGFKPETFWKIFAELHDTKDNHLHFEASVEPRDKSEVDRILDEGKKGSWKVTDIKEAQVKRAPRPPFITSTLQQAASSRLGFAPSRTMMVAQRLYEAGLITYMRTDSTNLGVQAKNDIRSIVEKKFGANYFESHVFAKKSKNAQEAHEAIRPTHMSAENAGHTDEQKRLYKLIWQRTLATQMKDALIMRTKVVANVEAKENDSKIPDFWLNGSRILFDGWTKADPAAQGEEVILPELTVGEKLNLVDIHSQELETQPPARYSEAGLIKELEKRGIGRPSTYASIIKTIVDRGYVEKDNKALKPTDVGDVVSTFLENNFQNYISDSFTAEMEDELDEVAQGLRTYEKTLKDFYGPFSRDVKDKANIEKITNLGDAPSEFKCPVCGSPMIVKLGRGGRFLSCSRFPDCVGSLTLDGHEIKADEPIGTDPETGKHIFIKTGRFGPYVQLGEEAKGKGSKSKDKARKASIPKTKNLSEVTLEDALKYLSLPRVLGKHPDTGETITANIGRFGPYIVHQKDFRSLKTDDVYTITLEHALEILKEPKKARGFARKAKKNVN